MTEYVIIISVCGILKYKTRRLYLEFNKRKKSIKGMR